MISSPTVTLPTWITLKEAPSHLKIYLSKTWNEGPLRESASSHDTPSRKITHAYACFQWEYPNLQGPTKRFRARRPCYTFHKGKLKSNWLPSEDKNPNRIMETQASLWRSGWILLQSSPSGWLLSFPVDSAVPVYVHCDFQPQNTGLSSKGPARAFPRARNVNLKSQCKRPHIWPCFISTDVNPGVPTQVLQVGGGSCLLAQLLVASHTPPPAHHMLLQGRSYIYLAEVRSTHSRCCLEETAQGTSTPLAWSLYSLVVASGHSKPPHHVVH